MTLELDVAQRTRTTAAIIEALQGACPDSICELRGSLAAGTADAYSDIDLRWTVGDADFHGACRKVGQMLEGIGEVASLRADRDSATHPTYRLMFARLTALPLFWRIDLEIISRDHDPEAIQPQRKPGSWSATNSALMCAVAAIKAFLRRDPEAGAHLVSKGFERIHIPVPAVSPRRQVLVLAETIYDTDDAYVPLAAQVRQLYREAFGGHEFDG